MKARVWSTQDKNHVSCHWCHHQHWHGESLCLSYCIDNKGASKQFLFVICIYVFVWYAVCILYTTSLMDYCYATVIWATWKGFENYSYVSYNVLVLELSMKCSLSKAKQPSVPCPTTTTPSQCPTWVHKRRCCFWQFCTLLSDHSSYIQTHVWYINVNISPAGCPAVHLFTKMCV